MIGWQRNSACISVANKTNELNCSKHGSMPASTSIDRNESRTYFLAKDASNLRRSLYGFEGMAVKAIVAVEIRNLGLPRLHSWLMRRPYEAEIVGSSPTRSILEALNEERRQVGQGRKLGTSHISAASERPLAPSASHT